MLFQRSHNTLTIYYVHFQNLTPYKAAAGLVRPHHAVLILQHLRLTFLVILNMDNRKCRTITVTTIDEPQASI